MVQPTDYHSMFMRWMEVYGKSYATETELAARMAVFIANNNFIETHNLEGHTYKLGHNQFSDLPFDEFKNLHLGAMSSKHILELTDDLPLASGAHDSKDWVYEGAVNPVRNQVGQKFYPSWAFAVTAAVESAHFIVNGNLNLLSEKDLIDCNTEGSDIVGAFRHISNHGQCLQAANEPPVPVEGGTCNNICDKTHGGIANFMQIQKNDEESLKRAVSQQPVSVGIFSLSQPFQFYSSGVLTTSGCDDYASLNQHDVLAVGYGVDDNDGLGYWKVRNSWGTSWGEDGYVRMERNNAGVAVAGVCGITKTPSFPIVSEHTGLRLLKRKRGGHTSGGNSSCEEGDSCEPLPVWAIVIIVIVIVVAGCYWCKSKMQQVAAEEEGGDGTIYAADEEEE